jgi:hypothetical protein
MIVPMERVFGGYWHADTRLREFLGPEKSFRGLQAFSGPPSVFGASEGFGVLEVFGGLEDLGGLEDFEARREFLTPARLGGPAAAGARRPLRRSSISSRKRRAAEGSLDQG